MPRISSSSFAQGTNVQGVREARVGTPIDAGQKAKAQAYGAAENFMFEYELKKKQEEGRLYQQEATMDYEEKMNGFKQSVSMFLNDKGELDLDRDILDKEGNPIKLRAALKKKQFNEFTEQDVSSLQSLSKNLPNESIDMFDKLTYSQLTQMKQSEIDADLKSKSPYDEAYSSYDSRIAPMKNNDLLQAKNEERRLFVTSAQRREDNYIGRMVQQERNNKELNIDNFNARLKRGKGMIQAGIGSYHSIESANAAVQKLQMESAKAFLDKALELKSYDSLRQGMAFLRGSMGFTDKEKKSISEYSYKSVTVDDFREMSAEDKKNYVYNIKTKRYEDQTQLFKDPEETFSFQLRHESEGAIPQQMREEYFNRFNKLIGIQQNDNLRGLKQDINAYYSAALRGDTSSLNQNQVNDIYDRIMTTPELQLSPRDKQALVTRTYVAQVMGNVIKDSKMLPPDKRANSVEQIQSDINEALKRSTEVFPELKGLIDTKTSFAAMSEPWLKTIGLGFNELDKEFKADPANYVMKYGDDLESAYSQAEMTGNPQDFDNFFRKSMSAQLSRGARYDDLRYLSKEQSIQYANRFKAAMESNNGGIELHQLQARFGNNFLKVFDEVIKDHKLDKQLMVAAAPADLNTKELVLNMVKQRKDINARFKNEKIKNKEVNELGFQNDLNKATLEFNQAFGSSDFSRNDFIKDFKDVIGVRAKDLILNRDMSYGDAIKAAKEEILDSTFGVINDNIFYHKSYAQDVNEDVINSFVKINSKPEGLYKYDVAIDKSQIESAKTMGLPTDPESVKKRVITQASRMGKWVTSPSMDGLVFRYKNKNGGSSTLRDSKGAPIEVKFKEITTSPLHDDTLKDL